MVNRLLEKGASLQGNKLFNFPIMGPALNGNIEVVERLLDAGSVANPSNDKNSLLKYVEEASNEAMLNLLKSHIDE